MPSSLAKMIMDISDRFTRQITQSTAQLQVISYESIIKNLILLAFWNAGGRFAFA